MKVCNMDCLHCIHNDCINDGLFTKAEYSLSTELDKQANSEIARDKKSKNYITANFKARQKRYAQSDKGKARQRRYNTSEKGIDTRKAYTHTVEYHEQRNAKARAFRQTLAGQLKQQEITEKRKAYQHEYYLAHKEEKIAKQKHSQKLYIKTHKKEIADRRKQYDHERYLKRKAEKLAMCNTDQNT